KGMRFHKVLSTPAAPEQAILEGLNDLHIDPDQLGIIHGSTVATNAVLQDRGARTAYISNRGLKDVLSIGRQARRELYELQPDKPPPPVPPELCLEVPVRRAANGELIQALSDRDLAELVDQLRRLRPEAVAINLLFSFINGEDESRIAAAIPETLFVSCSHRVLPEYREYERGIATWLNAAVGPLVQGYLQRFNAAVDPARVRVMRSSGQTCDTGQAGREAVHLLLSGPAGGLAGARYSGEQAGMTRLLSFDMGGTSTDVAMIDGDISLTSNGRIGPYPVGVPMIDLHTIGAGGGSIAWVDAGGRLVVGPQSAGSDPGPACYGQGGRRPTVTDANLVLGRLPQTTRLAGRLGIDAAAARQVLDGLAGQLRLDSVNEAAAGVIRIVNENMAQALRVISIQRGIDPRDFVLLAFGGAGGLHICALAEALQMRRAMVPAQAGVLSALGMLVAAPGRQLSRTIAGLLNEYRDADLNRMLSELEREGREILAAEGIDAETITCRPSVDLCYRGQSSSLNLPHDTIDNLQRQFHRLHEHRFGHALATDIELVNLRMTVNAAALDLVMPEYQPAGEFRSMAESTVQGCSDPVPVFDRYVLPLNQIIPGPAIIVDAISTTFIQAGWHASVDRFANLQLHAAEDGPAA
ncbi:MAG: hydantoinase/oxoprolinase family protein, partial [Thiotrichales bacterium]|nr:hydantoinase/oxoprolinase family protein [Thiotrichales bacterium]